MPWASTATSSRSPVFHSVIIISGSRYQEMRSIPGEAAANIPEPPLGIVPRTPRDHHTNDSPT